MGNKDWLFDSGIITYRSVDQGFNGIHYFQSLRWHKESFGAFVQINVGSVTGNFENISASKLIGLRKSPTSRRNTETGGFQRNEATYCINNCY